MKYKKLIYHLFQVYKLLNGSKYFIRWKKWVKDINTKIKNYLKTIKNGYNWWTNPISKGEKCEPLFLCLVFNILE